MKALCLTRRHFDDRIPCGGNGRAIRAACSHLFLLLLLFALLAILNHPPRARADGAFLSPYGRDVWEPAQKAIILFDEATQTEELIIQPSFMAFTPDFAWVVPVPSLPELDTAEGALFFECSDLTRPVWRQRGRGGCSGFGPQTLPTPMENGGILVHDERLVGIYQTLTIGASNAGVLTDSLDTWGYLHAENRAAVEAALQFYIDRSWVFVAMKIDSTRFWERTSDRVPWLGAIDPICLTFAAEEIVYPMRLSAISAAAETEVLLYVCAEHRMTFSGATTEYAHRLSAIELPVIRSQYEILGGLLERPCFMTKLRRTFAPREMTGDIVFTRTEGDHEYREVRYYGDASLGGGLVMLVAYFLVAWTRRRAMSPAGGEADDGPTDDQAVVRG